MEHSLSGCLRASVPPETSPECPWGQAPATWGGLSPQTKSSAYGQVLNRVTSNAREPRGSKSQGHGLTFLKSSLSLRNTTEVIRKRKHNPPARFAKTCLPESHQAFCLKRHSEQSRAWVTVHTGDWALYVKIHSIMEASFPVFSFSLMQWMIKVNLTPQ